MTEEQTRASSAAARPRRGGGAREGRVGGTARRGHRPGRARRLRRAARDARRGPGARERRARAHDRLGRAGDRGRHRPRARATRPTRRPTAGTRRRRRAWSPTRRTSAPRPASPTPTTLPASRSVRAGGGAGRHRARAAGVRLALRAGPRRARARGEGAPRPGPRRVPVDGGGRGARRDLRAAQGRRLRAATRARANLLLAVDLVHPPTGTVIEVDEREHFTSFRARARSSSTRPDAALGFDREEHQGRCAAALAARDRRAVTRARRRRASASAACRASAPTTTRCAISRSRRWVTRRSCGSRPSTATARAAYERHRATLLQLALAQARVVHVGRRDVDRPADAAAHAHLVGHLLLVHRLGEDVAALDADVVVGAVAVEGRAVRVLLDRGPAVVGHLALAHRPHRDPRHQTWPSLEVKSLISASSTPTTTPSPIDAALPVICAWVWIVPPPSRSWNVTSALACPVPPDSRERTRSERGVRRLVLLDHLDGADQLHRHRPHPHQDLGLDLLRARRPP